MDWTDAVFPITGPDPKGETHGTGFACGRDGDALYVVTCWHVVRAIGAENLRIRGTPCALVSSPGDDVLDLAVLQVEGLAVDQVLGLAQQAASGKTFATFGYAVEGNEPESFVVGRELSAVLGAKTRREHSSNKQVPAWDYYLQNDARELEKVKVGYSGAPVYDPSTHRVVAVITHRQGTDKGFAIDIANLERIYPQVVRFFALSSFRDPLQDGGVGPEMVNLPGGTFQMGSPDTEPGRISYEGPQHPVSVKPFAISRTAVRFADYDRFAAATSRRKPDDAGWGRGERPVVDVSWNDARAYAEWLSAQTGQRYRLPTEAEWEYAARAGTTTPFWTGDCIHTDQANYDGNYDYDGCGARTGVYRKQTVPVASLPANAFGLHEMAGNVWEWTEDCWHDDYTGAPADGSAWLDAQGGDCARRVLRGGSWFSLPGNLRSAARSRITADGANDFAGIRLARTP